ncbi:MAG TPA: hypothetical protein DEQ03_19360 [Marinilabiliales bacterium]|nr:hypothetical protein [Marinilabiliales bacterium]
MVIIPEPISFEWDSGNIDKNLKRHKVSCQEAEEVFVNQPLIVVEDNKHSAIEKRYQALGKSGENRLLFISFTVKKQKIRIISIRDMDKKGKNEYKKTQSNTKI